MSEESCVRCGHSHHLRNECRHGWTIVVQDGYGVGWRADMVGSACACGYVEAREAEQRREDALRESGAAKERERWAAAIQMERAQWRPEERPGAEHVRLAFRSVLIRLGIAQ